MDGHSSIWRTWGAIGLWLLALPLALPSEAVATSGGAPTDLCRLMKLQPDCHHDQRSNGPRHPGLALLFGSARARPGRERSWRRNGGRGHHRHRPGPDIEAGSSAGS